MAHTNSSKNPSEKVFWLFRISFLLYSVVGFLVATVVGQVVSWLTNGAAQQIDENLLIPFFQSKEFKQRIRRRENDTKYVTIDQMLVEMKKFEHKNGVNGHDDEAIVFEVNGKPTSN